MNDNDVEMLKIDLDSLRQWAIENAVITNPGTSKAVSFATALVKNSLN
jgi:hypothetical protein